MVDVAMHPSMDIARMAFMDTTTWDDSLWQQAMFLNWVHWTERRGRHFNSDEKVLSKLLRMGALDPLDMDKCGEDGIRSIRFAAATSSRLWSLLEMEQERVSLQDCLLFNKQY